MADTRQRIFSFVVYEDSAPADFKQRIIDSCVQGYFIYHDKDKNEDGTPKKPHYHVILFFDGKKSEKQIHDFIVSCGAANEQFIDVISPVGMSRYLTHMDNPDKYQYSPTDIVVLGGYKPYLEYIATSADITKQIAEMEDKIEELNIFTYHAFCVWCRHNARDWHYLLITRCAYHIDKYIKSRTWEKMNPIPEA